MTGSGTDSKEWCDRCKISFDTYQLHVQHRITSLEHIVCVVCNIEYHTSQGLDRHMKQNHAAEQDLQCPYCDDHFTRIGALIGHYEYENCPILHKEAFIRRRIARETVKQGPHNKLQHTIPSSIADKELDITGEIEGLKFQDPPLKSWDAWDEDDAPNPGMQKPLVPTKIGTPRQSKSKPEIFQQRKDHTMINTAVVAGKKAIQGEIAISPAENFSTTTALNSIDSNSTFGYSTQSDISRTLPYPLRNSSTKQATTRDLTNANQTSYGRSKVDVPTLVPGNDPSSATSWPKLGDIQQQKTYGERQESKNTQSHTSGKPKFVKALPEVLDGTTALVRYKPSNLENNIPQLPAYGMYDPRDPDFRVEDYRNQITGYYNCPHTICTKTWKTGHSLTAHLGSAVHAPSSLRILCPSCLDEFATVTAITQHAESQSVRCRLRESGLYRQFLDQVGAGIVNTDGRHADATLRYTTLRSISSGGGASGLVAPLQIESQRVFGDLQREHWEAREKEADTEMARRGRAQEW